MSSFDPKEVAFAVITYYPKWYSGKLRSLKHTDKVRGDLAIEFVMKAVRLGYQLVIIDGESSKTFIKEIEKYPEIQFVRGKARKRSPKKRQAIKICSKLPGVRAIILTEAEKVSLITDCLPAIVLPILENKADIVVPKREEKLFKQTYPGYMYETEFEVNALCNEQLKLYGVLPKHLSDMDLCFGPRVLKNDPKIIRLFMSKYRLSVGSYTISDKLFDPEEFSNVQFFPVVQALRRNLKVESVEVPFMYPELQKENEDIGERSVFIEKRRNQGLSILLDLMHFLHYLERRKNTRLRVVR